MNKVISLAKITREIRLTSYPSRFPNIINAPSMTNNGGLRISNMTCRGWLWVNNVIHRGYKPISSMASSI
jgi:hypothetical protein